MKKMNIFVLGNFMVGKSTIINAICHREILPKYQSWDAHIQKSENVSLSIREGHIHSDHFVKEMLTSINEDKTCSLVLYVMDATQLAIKDDEVLLRKVLKAMKRNGKELGDHFIFIINKCDLLDEERESLEERLEDVKSNLLKFGVKDPILIPMSAEIATLIQKVSCGAELTKREKQELIDVDVWIETPSLHLEKYAIVSPDIELRITTNLLSWKYKGLYKMIRDANMEAYLHSGFPVLEEVLKKYGRKFEEYLEADDSENNEENENSENNGNSENKIVENPFLRNIEIDVSKIFPVAVVATMSSGKSTLINALLNADILPSKNMACTARVFGVVDNDMAEGIKVYVAKTNGTQIVLTENIAEQLKIFNEDEDVAEILVESNIQGIKNIQQSVAIFDTPGVNNSMDVSHEDTTKEFLHHIKRGLIVYVLNATQMGINDDQRLLRMIVEYQKKCPDVNVVFALNKVDLLDEEKESLLDIMESTKDYLQKNGIELPDIIPVSALAANLFKKVLRGEELSRKQRHSFEYVYDLYKDSGNDLRVYAHLKTMKRQFEKICVGTKEYMVSDIHRAIENTGITMLEEYIEDGLIAAGDISTPEIRFKKKLKEREKHMTKIEIEYNPYVLELKIKKNGKEIKKGVGVIGNKIKNKIRLQNLLGKASGWKGLIEEIVSNCNDDEICIVFKGRKIDFEDLQYSVDNYEGDAKIELQLIEAKNDNDIIKELDNIFAKIKKLNWPEFQKENDNGETIFDVYKQTKENVFEVNVIATMSSGKSTLINSMLHTNLLPSKNEACTAKVTEILDNDSMDVFEARGCKGENEIYPKMVVDRKILEQWNKEKEVDYIELEGNIPGIDSDKMRILLCDTPGPNNSNDVRHEQITDAIIEKEDNNLVMYVMNATQLSINDDEALLRKVASAMKRNGKESRDRFIFIVNKCDALDEEKESLEECLEKVKRYLLRFDIEDPILMPASARMALLVRMDKKGEHLSRKERTDLSEKDAYYSVEKMHFEKYATLTPSVSRILEDRIKKYEVQEETRDEVIEIHTGIPALEETLKEYIEKYAYPMKFQDALQDIFEILNDIDMKGKLDISVAEDEKELTRVRCALEDAQSKYEEGKSAYSIFSDEIEQFRPDRSIVEASEKEVDKALGMISRGYVGRTAVDEAEAINVLSKFNSEVENCVATCRNRLMIQVDEEIFKQGERMLDEYLKVVEDILDKAKINNYEFAKCSLSKIQLRSVEDLKRSGASKRYRDEIRWKKNPEREGFFGRFKVWKPKEISYTVKVEDGIDVNIQKVVEEAMSDINAQIKKKMNELYCLTENQVMEYRNVFKGNLQKLDEVVKEEFATMRRNMADRETIRKRVAANKEKLQIVQSIEAELRQVISF